MKRKYKFAIVIISFLLLVGFLYMENNFLDITELVIESSKVPSNFNDFKILQISDLHGKSFGDNQKLLLKKVKEVSPDIIVITGDFIDSRRYDEESSLEVIQQISNDYPVYFVTGNHEKRSGKFKNLEEKLNKLNVTVLRNESIGINKDGQTISILGVDDPTFNPNISYMDSYMEGSTLETNIKKLTSNLSNDEFKILLSHRPELFSVYINEGIDLVFTGHAHGGQIRIPFLGGIIAPGQGIFPTYTNGLYKEGNTTMLVSRGLGNSLFPQRIFNRPNIVVGKLKSTK